MTFEATQNGELKLYFDRQTRLDHEGFRVWLSLTPNVDTSVQPDADTKMNPFTIYNLEDGVTYYFKVGTYTKFATAWNDCVFSELQRVTIMNEAQHSALLRNLI